MADNGWFTVQVTGQDKLQKELQGYISRCDDLMPILRICGIDLQTTFLKHFTEQKGPDGAWPAFAMFRQGTHAYEMYQLYGIPQKRPSGASVNASSKLLLDTGTLRNSIQILRLSSNEVATGTTLVYAGTHQFGNQSRSVPARPFIYILDADVSRLVNLVARYLNSGRAE